MCPIRNWVARSPLLRKGGAHTRSASANRFSVRNATQDAIDEWLDDLDDEAADSNDSCTDTPTSRSQSGPSGPDWDGLGDCMLVALRPGATRSSRVGT